MPNPTEQVDAVDGDDEEGPEMSWSKYHKLAREYADAQYGLRRVPVDTWKTYWATGVPYTHAARLANEARNPRWTNA